MGKEYAVIVVGGGHAGCEAALAAARLGCKTLLITMNLDTIAQMSCNPAIGGPAAKSHLVREIDALGGQMAKVIDQTYLNIRMLNLSRGPAVHALRAQADKVKYRAVMTKTLESELNLSVRQGVVTKILVDDGVVYGVQLKTGTKTTSDTVILATGTFLRGEVVIGPVRYPGGRQGEPSAEELSQSLIGSGLKLSRFQTATPPRVHADSVDYEKLTCQRGSDTPLRFSFDTPLVAREQIPCWYTRTTPDTIKVIRENIHLSPIQTGAIQTKGPRYCPSIDRKVLRFPDKTDHQIFLEPEGEYTKELYCLGLTTSMPEEIQLKILRSIPGLEQAEIMRTGYAVEYDYILPDQVYPTLESKLIQGLFTAGQINGTSGYEEAAAQGLIAGINAAHKVKGNPSLILSRSQAYIGVLIDDLVTKGTEEPYRMMTSRAEYRLILRQDNADLRLREIGYKVGLIDEARYQKLVTKKQAIQDTLQWLQQVQVSPTAEVRDYLIQLGSGDLKKAVTLHEILQRPEVQFRDLCFFASLPELDPEVIEQVEIECKFKGYIERQLKQIEQFNKLEGIAIPEDIDYHQIQGLRTEARERLTAIKPASLGQAARISGVSPADINVLLVVLKGDRQHVSA
ncbi:MAG TPA: tRNA uridine-5-carboxymethylaminomethyl(34) synthesis enzyme MnmG [Firmicutes bacterium]|nr:tRNA uridine-5-carboxymethylaminomethyl(34) synthesis enzyme MnmG [Bacillota bacterium]